ncbi:MAG: hypothetical protein JRH18_13825 [Deltaproteobacteria bacterium]|nr:hypothetical protein [Deltaproteobacteria bacterium]MBW2152734.1 hypothetical protein [Deltaproteobacteria bacterium]
MKHLRYYLPGSMMIFIAFLIIAVPQLLVALVAASMVMIGLGLLCVGHLIRKSEIEFHRIDPWVTVDSCYDRPWLRFPFVRIWYQDF